MNYYCDKGDENTKLRSKTNQYKSRNYKLMELAKNITFIRKKIQLSIIKTISLENLKQYTIKISDLYTKNSSLSNS